jgi:two-component system response regulator YesN
MYKVLLVDDEPSVIQLLENLIDWKSLGYEICGTSSNGEEALEILKQCNPHLAIIDIRMPKIDGLQLLHKASEILYLKTKFIILSAYSDFEYARTAMRYKVSDYILKPIDDDDVVPALIKVRDKIEREIETQESEVNKLKFAASNYINRMIKDEIRQETMERCKNMLGFIEAKSFRCALVEIKQFERWMDELEDIEIQRKRLAVREAIEGAVGREHVLNIFDEEIHRFGIIITEDMLIKEEKFLEKLERIIWKNCQCAVSVSLSEVAKGLENMGKLYKQALTALQYRLFQKDAGILYYEKFKNITLNYNFCKSNPEELLTDIKTNNVTGIKEKVNNVFDEFYKKKCAPEVIVNYIKIIEFEIVKHVHAHEGSVDEIINRLELLSATIGKTPVVLLKEEFYSLSLYISDYYKSISSRSSKDVIIEIKDYVQQHYYKDLKLQQVAKEYFVNPVYLGQIFAKTVGMHFNDYVHSVRIEEAKKLLRRTDMKICVIASKVGYSDTEYFGSKFKAITQHLPSDYRKKQHNENI